VRSLSLSLSPPPSLPSSVSFSLIHKWRKCMQYMHNAHTQAYNHTHKNIHTQRNYIHTYVSVIFSPNHNPTIQLHTKSHTLATVHNLMQPLTITPNLTTTLKITHITTTPQSCIHSHT
jgi:hypothetical protein